MDQAAMKQVFHAMKSRMSILDVDGLRESRKVEGLYAYEQETRGFPSMMIYLDQGVSDNSEEIAEILAGIDRYIGGYYSGQRRRYLFSFAGRDEILVRHAHTSIRMTTLQQWKQWTTYIENDNAVPEPIITSLFAGQKFGSGPFPGKRDLLIFFSRSRQVTMPEKVLKQFSFLKGNALWFFFENEKIEWEFGKFMPCLGGSSETPNENIAD